MIHMASVTKSLIKYFLEGALVLLCVGLPSCAKKEPAITKDDVIQERVTKRLNTWKRNWEMKCRKNVMDRATAIVDSTIVANARLNRDTAGLPPLPERPQKPEFIAPDDSLPVQPLLTPPDTAVNSSQQ